MSISFPNIDDVEASLRQIEGVVALTWNINDTGIEVDLIVTPGDLLQNALSSANEISKRTSEVDFHCQGIGLPHSEHEIGPSKFSPRKILHLEENSLRNNDGRVTLRLELGDIVENGFSEVGDSPTSAVVDGMKKIGAKIGNEALVELASTLEINKISVDEEIRHSARVELTTSLGTSVGVARGASSDEACALATIHACTRLLPMI